MKVSPETKQELLKQVVALTDEKAFKADRHQALDRLREMLNTMDDREHSRMRELAEGSARVHGTIWVAPCGSGFAAYDHEGKMIRDTVGPTKAAVEDLVLGLMPKGGLLEHVDFMAENVRKAKPIPSLPARPARRMRAAT